MKKLELKHIAYYLPYGLSVLTGDGIGKIIGIPDFFINKDVIKIHFGSNIKRKKFDFGYDDSTFNKSQNYGYYYINSVVIQNILDEREIYNFEDSRAIPILRPLSDLTKEQKEEIGGMLFNYSISGTDAQTEAEDWIRNDMSPTMSLNKCVDVCEYLFSIHADVHNLIPSGLAVNIKTLNKQ